MNLNRDANLRYIIYVVLGTFDFFMFFQGLLTFANNRLVVQRITSNEHQLTDNDLNWSKKRNHCEPFSIKKVLDLTEL